MAAKPKSDPHLEIAHVLFIDVVGYSKLLVNEQREVVERLNQIVRKTPQFRKSEAAGKLIRIPAGDGMALVFFQTPEEPVQCAMEIARALKNHPQIRVRMGVHSGPVDQVKDVNDRLNVAGAGINIAQRLMDCADAGHILISKRVADDLAQDRHWHPLLHEFGEVELKHGHRVEIVNVYTEELGNPEVPGKLVQPQRAHKSDSASAPPVSRATSFIPEKSIAVLPFENLSADPENAFFAIGVQDEILTNLAKIADLKVISRTSVMQYKVDMKRNLRDIADALGVANVVEGTVQRAGNRVRVSAQLIDARSDMHLWGENYHRPIDDVFAIQSEIAKMVADQLQAKLSPSEKAAIERPPTADLVAFDLYTRARNLLPTAYGNTRAALLQAADLLNQAVVRDPSFFQAYCQLAYVHDRLYFFGFDHTSARLALAEAAIQAASRLRPDAGEMHLARAQNLYWGYLDYDGALAELEVAGRTLPNDPGIFRLTGYILRRQGRWEESTRNLERGVDLDPRNIETLRVGVASNYLYFRRYAEEKSVYDRVLAFEPDDAVTKAQRALIELDLKADTQPLHQMIDSIRATNPAAITSIADNWLLCALAEHDAAAAKNALISQGDKPFYLGLTDNVHLNRPSVEGVIARMAKDDDKARSAFTAARAEQEKIVQAQPNYGPALCVLGLIDAGLGRKEEALREGRRAVELLPVEKDAVQGPAMIKYLAMIAAWVGDKDLAFEQLTIAIRHPSDLSYGQLKLLPFWDPLRGDPRFERIVLESQKPVVVK